jgi:hypothetical protein
MIFFFFNLNLKEERNVDVCGDSLLNVKSIANFSIKSIGPQATYLCMHLPQIKSVSSHSFMKERQLKAQPCIIIMYIYFLPIQHKSTAHAWSHSQTRYRVQCTCFLPIYLHILLPQQGQILCFLHEYLYYRI